MITPVRVSCSARRNIVAGDSSSQRATTENLVSVFARQLYSLTRKWLALTSSIIAVVGISAAKVYQAAIWRAERGRYLDSLSQPWLRRRLAHCFESLRQVVVGTPGRKRITTQRSKRCQTNHKPGFSIPGIMLRPLPKPDSTHTGARIR